MPISEATSGSYNENVHTLPTDIISLERLLFRLTAVNGPNALDFAERRSLITTAIETTRKEIHRMRKVLIELEHKALSLRTAENHSTPAHAASVSPSLLREVLNESEKLLHFLEGHLNLSASKPNQIVESH